MNNNHTFFKVITIPEGKEEKAFEALKALSSFMETQEGFQDLVRQFTDLGG